MTRKAVHSWKQVFICLWHYMFTSLIQTSSGRCIGGIVFSLITYILQGGVAFLYYLTTLRYVLVTEIFLVCVYPVVSTLS